MTCYNSSCHPKHSRCPCQCGSIVVSHDFKIPCDSQAVAKNCGKSSKRREFLAIFAAPIEDLCHLVENPDCIFYKNIHLFIFLNDRQQSTLGTRGFSRVRRDFCVAGLAGRRPTQLRSGTQGISRGTLCEMTSSLNSSQYRNTNAK